MVPGGGIPPTTESRTHNLQVDRGDDGNEEADRLANKGALKEAPDDIATAVPKNFRTMGIKLLSTTQALVYSAITQSNPLPLTDATKNNIELTRCEIQNMTTNLETNPSIWRSIRHPDIRRPIQSFLYRAMHNSLRVGKFWLHIKNLEHILTQCPSPERTTI